MKHLNFGTRVIFVIAACFLLAACGGKEKVVTSDEWPEMEAYHMIVAEAYHPMKDSSNLAPAKASAELIATEADKWADAALPEKVNTDEMKAMLSELKTRAHAFADQVKSGATEEELGKSLTEFHDTFHHIMEAWHGGQEEHH